MKFPSKIVWICFLIHTLIIAASYLLADKLPHHEPAGFIDQSLYPLSPYIEKLIKWDAHWYTYIAGHGYTSQSIVFFPAIIVFMKILSYFGLNFAVAGLIICNLFAFLSFWIMYLTFRLDFTEKEVTYALLSYAVMPTSLFLNSIYTEPIFITSSLACVYCARVGKWWYAGLAGALAALTRNLGIFLFLFLLYEFMKSNPLLRKGKYAAFPIFLPPAALLLFMIYNFYLLGDPVAFIASQQGWGRHFGLPWQNIWNNLPLTFTNNPANQPGAALDSFIVIISLIGLLCTTFLPKFKVRTSYLIIGWLWFMVPLVFTATELPLYSMSRFVLPIFPLYLFFARLPEKFFYCYITVSAFALLLCTSLFINWYWIG
ncbi:MAG: hypothetical protein H7X79_03445 [Sporomusaceae bacterium]|nr:hypothetical protein [Sporomusaceae bacterium]